MQRYYSTLKSPSTKHECLGKAYIFYKRRKCTIPDYSDGRLKARSNQKKFKSKILTADQLMAHHLSIRGLIMSSGFSARQANAIMLILRLQVISGQAFASAKFIGKKSNLSEKGIDRLVKKLRSLGLLKTVRRRRSNGTLGTNILDLTPLMKLLLRAVGRMLNVPKWAWNRIKQRVEVFSWGCSIKWYIHYKGIHDRGEGWLRLKFEPATGRA